MKSVIKIIAILITILITFTYLSTKTYATDNIIKDGSSFIDAGKSEQGNTIDETKLKETSDFIYNVLFSIAVVIAFAVGMVIGIQFIMGSADEKAKIKETLLPYIIGVCVIFGAFTIWKIVVNIGNDIESTKGIYDSTENGRYR